MNHVDSVVHHGFHRREDFRDVESSGQARGAGAYNVRDSSNLRVMDSLNGACVKFTYVAGSNQSDPEISIWRQSGSLSNLLCVAIELFHPGKWSSRGLTGG